MRGRVLITGMLAGALLSGACGSKAPSKGGGSSCGPSGSILTETVKNVAYGATCLAAPGNTAFKINLDNQDAGIPHNMQIFDKDPRQDSSARSLFKGTLVTGPAQTTYEIGALAVGTYHFRCDVHPDQMFGMLVVGG